MKEVGKWMTEHGFQILKGDSCQLCRSLVRDKNGNRYCLEMITDGISRMEARIDDPRRSLCSAFDGRENISAEIPF
jgi:hypothetical protein